VNSRKEMIPAPDRKEHHSIGLCNPEWQLLCWIRRELGNVELNATKKQMRSDIIRIVTTMNETFTDWPEDPK